jgi:hypothetical protein
MLLKRLKVSGRNHLKGALLFEPPDSTETYAIWSSCHTFHSRDINNMCDYYMQAPSCGIYVLI